ncbi:hypothetical protein Q4566_13060 [Tamlana sp. 2_MG-2023]|uniref:hypothetical protein n=1 Tax=unclassified Tamlana TaxID=2614803 RepID=UPI0026E326FE|nr:MULTISPECIES: hypothetical protein [unclassified Tamlana]MDO6761134.1 hypothetical protein [Tamlana sp. 2_MG-2023]MDO6791533.1 hypothetical protein [Tamlana sp. 1_MG-2023]
MVNLLRSKHEELGFQTNTNVKALSMSLNNEQMEAMVHSFLMVMMADEHELNLKMYNYIHEQFDAIGFDIKKQYVHKYASRADDEAYAVLEQLTVEQKKWFAIALHDMLYKLGTLPSFKQVEQYNIIRRKSLNTYMQEANY